MLTNDRLVAETTNSSIRSDENAAPLNLRMSAAFGDWVMIAGTLATSICSLLRKVEG